MCIIHMTKIHVHVCDSRSPRPSEPSLKNATPQFAHLEKFNLSFLEVFFVNLLPPKPSLFLVFF